MRSWFKSWSGPLFSLPSCYVWCHAYDQPLELTGERSWDLVFKGEINCLKGGLTVGPIQLLTLALELSIEHLIKDSGVTS